MRTMSYSLEQMLPNISQSMMLLCRHKLSGMDMTLCDYDGRTALHLAAAEGHLECVAFLLEHCNVPHNPKDRSVPPQIATSPSFFLAEYRELQCATQPQRQVSAISDCNVTFLYSHILISNIFCKSRGFEYHSTKQFLCYVVT